MDVDCASHLMGNGIDLCVDAYYIEVNPNAKVDLLICFFERTNLTRSSKDFVPIWSTVLQWEGE